MQDRDVMQVTNLLNSFLKNFMVAPEFSKEEVRHWFLPREKVMYSYVVEVSFNSGFIIGSSFTFGN